MHGYRLTVEDVGLNLLPGVAEAVEGVVGLVGDGAVLHGCHDGDEDVVLALGFAADVQLLHTEGKVAGDPPADAPGHEVATRLQHRVVPPARLLHGHRRLLHARAAQQLRQVSRVDGGR
jgi:hypothetical protein